MYGRLHADICNVPTLIINGVKMQIKFTKATPTFYLLCNKEDSKAYFKVLEALNESGQVLMFLQHIMNSTRRLSGQIQLNKNRTQDLHFRRRLAITLHEQRSPGSTPRNV